MNEEILPVRRAYRGGDAKSWLLTIVRNCSFDWSKSRRRAAGENTGAAGENPRIESEHSFGESLDRWIPNPDELGDCTQDGPETAVLRQSEIEEVRSMIRRLPEPFLAERIHCQKNARFIP